MKAIKENIKYPRGLSRNFRKVGILILEGGGSREKDSNMLGPFLGYPHFPWKIRCVSCILQVL